MNSQSINDLTPPPEAGDVAATGPIADKPGPTPGQVNADRQRAANARTWWRIVFASLVVPFLGFLTAIALAWRFGLTWLDLGLLVGMYTLTALGVEVGYHRLLTHQAFQTTPWLRQGLAIAGSMGVQGPVIFWAGIHRHHHKYSDQPVDRHSPQGFGEGLRGELRGLWSSQIAWIFHYQELSEWIGYAPELFRDPAIVHVHRRYFGWVALGVAVPTLIGGLATGSWYGALTGGLWGGLARIFLIGQFAYTINSVCHLWGSRPFATHDRSANNLWLVIPTFGGAFQNTHHAFPTSARTGLRWWQVDLGGWFILLLAACGLAWDVKVPTPEQIEAMRHA